MDESISNANLVSTSASVVSDGDSARRGARLPPQFDEFLQECERYGELFDHLTFSKLSYNGMANFVALSAGTCWDPLAGTLGSHPFWRK
jgi:hypothetical protein